MAKQQSLAAQSGAVEAPQFQLPAVFQAPQQPLVERFIAPYIVFAHPNRKDEWQKIVRIAPTAQDGDMFLVQQGGILPLPVAKLGWLCHRQYWVLNNAAGQVISTSLKEMPNPWKECVEAVVLVYLDESIVPANMLFRSTKCPAAFALATALQDSTQPSWAERSPAHKETLVMQQPFARFFGEVSLAPTRTSKNGPTYRPAQCTIRPTGIPEWRLLKAFSEAPSTQKQLEDASERFQIRVKEVESKLVK